MKSTITLAYPVIIGQVGHIMLGVVDSIMVGWVGVIPLAAASLSTRLFSIIIIFGLGMTMALTPLIAEAVGAGHPKRCGALLRQMLPVSVVTMLLLMAFSEGIIFLIPHLNQPPEVVPQAVSYLRILEFSIIPYIFFQVFRQFSEGLSFMWPPMILNILANFMNVFLNWVFIFGHLGFSPMGLRGAGIATFFTRCFMALALIIYVLRSKRYQPFLASFFPFNWDWAVIKSIVRIGSGSGFQYFFEMMAFSGAAVIVGWIDAESLAAHQVALSTAALTYMFANGVSIASAIRVGKARGEKNAVRIRQAGFSAIILGASIMFGFAVLIMILSGIIPHFYGTDPGVIRVASTLLMVVAFFQVSDGIQCVGLGALRGLADVKVPTIAAFISYWLIALPAGYILAFPLGLRAAGIWIGLLLGLTVSAVLLTVRFHKKTILTQGSTQPTRI